MEGRSGWLKTSRGQAIGDLTLAAGQGNFWDMSVSVSRLLAQRVGIALPATIIFS